MSKPLAIAEEIVSDVRDAIKALSETSIRKMTSLLQDAMKNKKKVFVMGEGPSGLVARALAMRLAELGYNVFVIGETITSSVEKDDLLIVISGSGKTPLVAEAAKIAKEKVGAKIISVTASKDSLIRRLADAVLLIKTSTAQSEDEDSYLNTQLTGSYKQSKRTIFEIAATCILEAIVSELS